MTDAKIKELLDAYKAAEAQRVAAVAAYRVAAIAASHAAHRAAYRIACRAAVAAWDAYQAAMKEKGGKP